MKKSSTAHLFIARHRHRSVVCRGLIVLLVTSAPVFSQTTVWTDGIGNWFTPANWSAGVPTSSTIAQINNGGTAQIMSSGAAASFVELGIGAGDAGTLSISGAGSLQDEGGMDIGEDGTGTLSITDGATVSSGNFIIGENAGSNGTATVSGSGSMWTNLGVCFVGYNGDGTLNISGGGQVSNENLTSIGENMGAGIVTVDGVGSSWSEGETIIVGGSGTGTLTISNGGYVYTNAGGGTFGSQIGNNPGSSGTVNAGGVGSTWMNEGPLAISEAGGVGALHITSGGAVSNAYCVIGAFSGNGTSTVEGVGSTWTISGDLFVGDHSGGVGMVTISQAGQVTSVNGYIANGSSSTGSVQIDGAGSAWANGGNVYVGGDINGAVGTGELDLIDGGTVGAAAVIVWGTGTVTGNGFVETTALTNHGMLAPNQSMSISGDLTFDSTAVMSSTVTPEAADSVTAQGTAALNGQLNITLSGGPFIVGTQYILLLANGGLNGTTFSNVSISAPPGVNAQVTYDTKNVHLVIGSAATPTPTPTPTHRPTPSPRPRPTPPPRP